MGTVMRRAMRFPVPISALPSRAQGFACVLYSILIWSGWMIVSAYSVRGSLSSYDIAAIRFTTAGIIYLPVIWRRGISIGPYGWKGSLWISALMGAPYSIVAIYGMRFAPVSHASAIINTTMLTVTTIASIFLLGEKTTPMRLLGLALSIAGIGVMLFSGHAAVGDRLVIGHVCFIIGGVMWAGYVVSAKAWRLAPLHASAIICVGSLALYVPVYLLFLPSHIGMQNIHEVLFQAVYQGVFNGVFALLCFNRGIEILGASTSSAFLPLVPPIAALLAIPALHEIPTWMEWTGIALAAVGVLLSTGIIAGRKTSLTTPVDGLEAGN